MVWKASEGQKQGMWHRVVSQSSIVVHDLVIGGLYIQSLSGGQQ